VAFFIHSPFPANQIDMSQARNANAPVLNLSAMRADSKTSLRILVEEFGDAYLATHRAL
jgi:hypothetical protein